MNNRNYLMKSAGPLTLGAMLAAIRDDEGQSLREMAEVLGVSAQHLSDVIHDRRGVSPARALEWGRKLGYPEWQFLKLALNDSLRRDGVDFVVSVKVKPAKTGEAA